MVEPTPYSQQYGKSLWRMLKFYVWLMRKDIRKDIPSQPFSVSKKKIYQKFAEILPEIPQAAPEGDRLQGPVNFAFIVVAIRSVYVRYGVPVDRLGASLERAVARMLRNPIIAFIFKRAGRKMFAPDNRQTMIDLGKISEKRLFPLGFVYRWKHTPQQDWRDHYTILECGICKVCAKYNAVDIVPYLCKLDFMLFSARGQDMARSKTIASGADCCDFRFRPVQKPPSRP